MNNIKAFIAKAADGEALSEDESRQAFDVIMSGEATPAQIGGFLMALRVRGETVGEIAGAVQTMRSKMTPVTAPDNAIDIVGTGGDGRGSYNVSTCAAIVVAGCGVPVAKHGNRNISSKSGAADALVALGVNIEIPPEKISRCIAQAGIGFMFAPAHHSAMRFVGPARQELGTRTIFNLIGPLSNPAGVRKHMIGVFSKQWVEPVARVLQELGSTDLWVVHGSDGLDEITTTGPTTVAQLKDGAIKKFEVSPNDVGIPIADPASLKGGEANENAAAINSVLEGKQNPYRDIVLINAAAALVVAGNAESLADGVAQATNSIDSGSAANRLNELIAASKEKL